MSPLEGVRVLDLSRMVAGGVAGMLLADFGADVVKVEQPPAGDPLRQWKSGGTSLWWKVYGRNKRCITLNLQTPEGQTLLRRLVPRFDVLLESFVPGTMERWGLGADALRALHPKLIVVRVSGWGQDGPGSRRPGFGTLVEAATGFAAMNGEADRPPILPSFPLADMASGLYAANAALMALYSRDVRGAAGADVDVSLFESLFSLLGPLAAEYAASGKVRTRTGNRSSNSSPRGCYATSDGNWIALSGSTPRMAERVLVGYQLGHLLQDPRFATNEARVRHAEDLDEAIRAAIGQRTLQENLVIVEAQQLTAHPVQTMADIERDPHWQARSLLVDVADGPATIRMHTVLPRFSATDGRIRTAGAELGAHNEDVFVGELGLDSDELPRLRAAGVI